VIAIHWHAILEAPSALGHVPDLLSAERAPGVLAAGLADRFAAMPTGSRPLA
jgi:hypothetical protein